MLQFASERDGRVQCYMFLHRTPIQDKSLTSLAAEHVMIVVTVCETTLENEPRRPVLGCKAINPATSVALLLLTRVRMHFGPLRSTVGASATLQLSSQTRLTHSKHHLKAHTRCFLFVFNMSLQHTGHNLNAAGSDVHNLTVSKQAVMFSSKHGPPAE